MTLTQLSAHDVRRVAVEAKVDPRTVRRRIDGKRVQSTTAARIDDALRALGLTMSEKSRGMLAAGIESARAEPLREVPRGQR